MQSEPQTENEQHGGEQEPFHFKIMVDGASGTGKTAFIQRLRTGEFSKGYLPTLGVDVTPLSFDTTRGMIIFKMWDLSGNNAFRGGDDAEGYYTGAHGLLAFYDTLNPIAKERAMYLAHKHRDLQVLYCGGKRDIEAGLIQYTHNCLVSAKTGEGIKDPLLAMARLLMKDETLKFIEQPTIDDTLPQLTKAGFQKLIGHPSFVLPFSAALQERYHDETTIEEPYCPLAREEVFNRRPFVAPIPKTRLYGNIARLLVKHETAVDDDSRGRWATLIEELSDDEWATLWARNGHRENVRWAIGEASADRATK